jgi:hypothetical protein
MSVSDSPRGASRTTGLRGSATGDLWGWGIDAEVLQDTAAANGFYRSAAEIGPQWIGYPTILNEL